MVIKRKDAYVQDALLTDDELQALAVSIRAHIVQYGPMVLGSVDTANLLNTIEDALSS